MKVYSFYLPQFHRTKENDKWWGEGFTDWISCNNSRPLFDDHYQPHIPMSGYYNLLDKATMKWQSALMKKYSVDGLCFYHYWFGNGQKALDKPISNLLMWKDIDMPFCFYWDVGSWVRSWSGLLGNSWIGNDIKENSDNSNGILFEFFEGREEEWKKHFEYLLPYFLDERYIRINDMPLFMIHNPMDLGCLNSMVNYWNRLAVENGIKGIFFIGNGDINRKLDSLNGILYHEPHHVMGRIDSYIKNGIKCYNYESATNGIENYPYKNNNKIFYSCFTGYDDTPRKGKQSIVYENSNPDNFERQLVEVMARNHINGNDITFINAWNEWGEGMHLEPDQKYEFGYLKAINNAKQLYEKYAISLSSKHDMRDVNNDNNENSKYELYFITLNKWLHNIGIGKNNIFSLLEKDKQKRIIVYGKSVFCEHLITASESNDNIEVVGIVDKKNVPSMGKIDSFRLGDELPQYDAIVVASFYYMSEITKELIENYGIKKIYSVEELVNNM